MAQGYDYAGHIERLKKQNPFLNSSGIARTILKDDILSGRRLPGSKLKQDEIARLLGISRSPVRDALIALAHEGIVVCKSGNGVPTHVYIPTIKDAKTACEYRRAIETECGILAARRQDSHDIKLLKDNVDDLADPKTITVAQLIDNDARFHEILINCSRNSMLIDAYHLYDTFFNLIRIATVTRPMKGCMVDRHTVIIDSIISRDLDRIRDAVRAHLDGNVEDIVEAEKYSYE